MLNNTTNITPNFNTLSPNDAINIAKAELRNKNYPYFSELTQVILNEGNLSNCVRWINVFGNDDKPDYRLLEVAQFFYDHANYFHDIEEWLLVEHYYYPPMIEKLLAQNQDTHFATMISIMSLDNRKFLTQEQRINYKKNLIVDGRVSEFVDKYNFALEIELLTHKNITQYSMNDFYGELFNMLPPHNCSIEKITKIFRDEWLENNNLVPDTTNMNAHDAWRFAKKIFYNPLVGPEYFRPLVDVIIREKDVQCAKDWIWLFTNFNYDGRNITDYFKDDVKNIIIQDDNDIDNILDWLRGAKLYDADVIRKYCQYSFTNKIVDENYLAYLLYSGKLNKANLNYVAQQLNLLGMPYIRTFVESYNKNIVNNEDNLNGNGTSINDFFALLDDCVQIGILI